MTRKEKKKNYNELSEKYDYFSDNPETRVKYGFITSVNRPGTDLIKDEIWRLYEESKMSALKNGFLRSFDKIYNDPRYSLEDKKRLYEKMVSVYYKMWLQIKIKINKLYKEQYKDGNIYYFWEKQKDVKKIKHY